VEVTARAGEEDLFDSLAVTELCQGEMLGQLASKTPIRRSLPQETRHGRGEQVTAHVGECLAEFQCMILEFSGKQSFQGPRGFPGALGADDAGDHVPDEVETFQVLGGEDRGQARSGGTGEQKRGGGHGSIISC